jgi:uncharacterized delta-60 repeat protein
MRSQTRWLRWVVGVFTLITTLFSMPATDSFAQASLFDPAFSFTSGPNDYAYSIVIQNDGKILVGGYFPQNGGQTSSGLLRLKPDGQIDQPFMGITNESVSQFLKQPDGKILVVGNFTSLQGVPRRRIGRLLTNGIVDLSFDAGASLESSDYAFALGLQADGKILVGTIVSSPQRSGGLMRLNSNGQVDDSFVQTNIFHGYHIFTIVPRTNGSILVGGGFQGVNDFSTPGLALVRTNGEIDTNFVSSIKPNSSSGVYAIVERSDGSLVVGGGFWRKGVTSRLVLARLTGELTWDTSFHPDVFDPTPGIFYTFDNYIMAMVQQPDGKLLLGGKFQEVGGYWRQCVARLSGEGRVDPCFDPGIGLVPGEQVFGVNSLTVQPDGKVLAAGNFINPMSSSHHLTRLLPQSECDAIRVHLFPNSRMVWGTCTPGGTNHLEWSTNLVNWETAMSSTTPFVYSDFSITGYDRMFFRVRKEY